MPKNIKTHKPNKSFVNKKTLRPTQKFRFFRLYNDIRINHNVSENWKKDEITSKYFKDD